MQWRSVLEGHHNEDGTFNMDSLFNITDVQKKKFDPAYDDFWEGGVHKYRKPKFRTVNKNADVTFQIPVNNKLNSNVGKVIQISVNNKLNSSVGNDNGHKIDDVVYHVLPNESSSTVLLPRSKIFLTKK